MKKPLILLILFLVTLVSFTQPPAETVGNPTKDTSVSSYTGWTNQGVLTYSGSAQVGSTQPSNNQGASGAGNVFFTNIPGTSFEISGFPSGNIDTIDHVELIYGIYCSDTANPNQLLIEYSQDSIHFYPITDTSNLIYPASTWSTRFVSFDSHFKVANLRLKFTQTSSTKQFRIDDIRLRYSILLSIKLQQFTSVLNGNTVQIFWTSTTQSKGEVFMVEKSADGINFTTIEEQFAKGAGTFSYSFTDRSPINAKSYYRLKMKNNDGSYSYSNILYGHPNYSSKNILVNLYPLPTKNILNIQVQSDTAEQAEILITDIYGKTLIKNSIALTEGINNALIKVQSLTPGIYFLKAATSKGIETRKIVVGR